MSLTDAFSNLMQLLVQALATFNETSAEMNSRPKQTFY